MKRRMVISLVVAIGILVGLGAMLWPQSTLAVPPFCDPFGGGPPANCQQQCVCVFLTCLESSAPACKSVQPCIALCN